ncbi:MAG: N-dimethylarginine dimethylaminohydrolase [Roseivirga sp.]|jgi:N-dimethylarginine dimethylaminohydrolase
MKTCHSEFGRIKSLWIKSAAAAFKEQSTLDKEWEALNYLACPNYEQAINEYQYFETLVKEDGLVLDYFETTNSVQIDSIYCRDAAIATDFGMVICNMGKAGRINEPKAQMAAFQKAGIPILGVIESPGTIEGGDVAWLDGKTLAVAHSYRTNPEGIRQLKAMLNPKGIEVLTVDLPHYKGQLDVFHLMSILSPVDQDLAVVYSPLMPISFRKELIQRGFNLVEVPDEEFESMGCNVLAVAPRQCLMVAGNPITEARLKAAGATVRTYEGANISVLGGGGPTCLTRPMEREV